MFTVSQSHQNGRKSRIQVIIDPEDNKGEGEGAMLVVIDGLSWQLLWLPRCGALSWSLDGAQFMNGSASHVTRFPSQLTAFLLPPAMFRVRLPGIGKWEREGRGSSNGAFLAIF